jgi:hypothetical protein
MDHLILIPAYCRDYKTADEVKADWEAGKDFIIMNVTSRWCGKPCSIRDYKDGVPEGSYIRYKNKTEITFIGKWD